MRASLCPDSLPVSFLQIPIAVTGHRKVQTDTMKAYQRQQQYIYRHCQLGNVTSGSALLISVCLLLLPVLELATEHVQLAIMYRNHRQVHPHHMTFHNYTRLILPSLNNVLPAMGIQKELARSNIMSLGPSSHSSTSHVLPSQAAIIPLGLGRMVVGVVVELLLLRSGNVEMNPGPVGKCTALMSLSM